MEDNRLPRYYSLKWGKNRYKKLFLENKVPFWYPKIFFSPKIGKQFCIKCQWFLECNVILKLINTDDQHLSDFPISAHKHDSLVYLTTHLSRSNHWAIGYWQFAHDFLLIKFPHGKEGNVSFCEKLLSCYFHEMTCTHLTTCVRVMHKRQHFKRNKSKNVIRFKKAWLKSTRSSW